MVRPPLSELPAAPDDEAHLPARRLFEALDNRAFLTPAGRSFIKVFSVFEHGDRRWVQLQMDGYSERMLTISIGRNEGVSEVLRTLAGWVASPGSQFSSVA
jgi:hypothetical protein